MLVWKLATIQQYHILYYSFMTLYIYQPMFEISCPLSFPLSLQRTDPRLVLSELSHVCSDSVRELFFGSFLQIHGIRMRRSDPAQFPLTSGKKRAWSGSGQVGVPKVTWKSFQNQRRIAMCGSKAVSKDFTTTVLLEFPPLSGHRKRRSCKADQPIGTAAESSYPHVSAHFWKAQFPFLPDIFAKSSVSWSF